VIDGDTIAVGSRHVRLQGIDAPETDQVSLDGQGERWTCGLTARERLSSHIADRGITCTAHGEDRYGRTLASCPELSATSLRIEQGGAQQAQP
jgi:endonuclease YncB( thermonuclease family)